MPTYKVTIKIINPKPPYQSLNGTEAITAASLLDAYCRFDDVLRKMPKPDPPTKDAPH